MERHRIADLIDWRKFECNNKTIALNILYVPYNTKQIKQAYISKHDNERDTQVNLLMITDETSNWQYLAVKIISGLSRGITLNHNGDFYCLNYFHLYTTEKNSESMKEYVKITIFAIQKCLVKIIKFPNMFQEKKH